MQTAILDEPSTTEKSPVVSVAELVFKRNLARFFATLCFVAMIIVLMVMAITINMGFITNSLTDAVCLTIYGIMFLAVVVLAYALAMNTFNFFEAQSEIAQIKTRNSIMAELHREHEDEG